jgi:NADH:ubiquinone oxidoreductase subunit 6 (subunit J)
MTNILPLPPIHDPLTPDMAAAGLFYLFSALSAGSALGVVISRNIVRTAVFLLGTLAGVAGLYFLLNSEFLAAVQLVVYAGGTLILIIFGVMLTSKSPYARFEPKRSEVALALAIAVLMLASLILGIKTSAFANRPFNGEQQYPVGLLGKSLLGDYLIPFELASVLLLVVMIGAAFLAKGRKHEH